MTDCILPCHSDLEHIPIILYGLVSKWPLCIFDPPTVIYTFIFKMYAINHSAIQNDYLGNIGSGAKILYSVKHRYNKFPSKPRM